MSCDHEWIFVGGRCAECFNMCTCSVGVYECKKCRFCDYGNNEELKNLINNCDKKEKYENSVFEDIMME